LWGKYEKIVEEINLEVNESFDIQGLMDCWNILMFILKVLYHNWKQLSRKGEESEVSLYLQCNKYYECWQKTKTFEPETKDSILIHINNTSISILHKFSEIHLEQGDIKTAS
jgi:hypothetical protein